jgi:3,4-dihydroxy-9,10-secoandrosta-1,3,5(10)-triene-9,17-dione 4,5-dioxygenase
MSVAALGYLRIESTDTTAWVQFGAEVLGLMEAPRPDSQGAQFLRMDNHPFRFMIEPAGQDRLAAVGLQYRDAATWQSTCDALASAEHAPTMGSAEEAERRCVSAFASVQDPSGNTVELFYGRKLDYRPFNSPAGVGRFITGDEYSGDLGLGHVVLPAPATAATLAFYTDLIGLEVCDDLHLPAPPDSRVIFMHADNPRQHSLALYNQAHPAGVVHIMVEVETLDEVGLALERVQRAGLPVLASLGRHVNDNMCSFYVSGPGGIAIEYGYDGLLVDWDNYTPTVSTEGDLWGHQYNFPGVNE